MPTIFFKIIVGTGFIILLSQLSIDLSFREIPIPITGQSLAVLTVAALLGFRNGTIAIGLYLLLGAIGLPVFANGAAGWEIFGKGSGGFLIGFLVAGGVVGLLSERWNYDNWLQMIGLMTIGTGIILIFGVAQLIRLYDFEKALEYGFYPFVIGAAIKILLGAGLVKLYKKIANS